MNAKTKNTTFPPLTRREFVNLKLTIEQQKFEPTDLGPLSYGIQRAYFERTKLEKLISAAERVEGKTAQAQADRWRRKLQKIEESQGKLQRLKEELVGSQSPVDGFQVNMPVGAARLD
jgi:hypothetical protein